MRVSDKGSPKLAWCAYALFAINVLVLLFAVCKLEGIHGQLAALIDVTDTRDLPRPDPLFSLAH